MPKRNAPMRPNDNMPKRNAPMRPNDNPAATFESADTTKTLRELKTEASKPVEVIHLPAASLSDAQAADLQSGLAKRQLDELAELLGNTLHASPGAVPVMITDARTRLALLRLTLGL